MNKNYLFALGFLTVAAGMTIGNLSHAHSEDSHHAATDLEKMGEKHRDLIRKAEALSKKQHDLKEKFGAAVREQKALNAEWEKLHEERKELYVQMKNHPRKDLSERAKELSDQRDKVHKAQDEAGRHWREAREKQEKVTGQWKELGKNEAKLTEILPGGDSHETNH